MKKQIKPHVKAHLIRAAFYLLRVLAVCVIPFAVAQRTVSKRTLTFAERVAYQRAIEEVYWHHRIWPKENPKPKPPLDAVISHAQLEEKVKIICGNRSWSQRNAVCRSLRSNFKWKLIEWPITANSPRCCANSLTHSATTPLL